MWSVNKMKSRGKAGGVLLVEDVKIKGRGRPVTLGENLSKITYKG